MKAFFFLVLLASAWSCSVQASSSARTIRQLDRAVALEPHRLEPRLELARALLEAGQARQAREVLEVATLDHPNDPRLSFFQGKLDLLEGDPAAALAHFQPAKAPASPPQAGRGPTTWARSRAGTMAPPLERCPTPASPPPGAPEVDSRVLVGKALALLDLGQASEADQLLSQALAVNSADKHARINRVRARSRLGRFEGAMNDLEAAIELGVDEAVLAALGREIEIAMSLHGGASVPEPAPSAQVPEPPLSPLPGPGTSRSWSPSPQIRLPSPSKNTQTRQVWGELSGTWPTDRVESRTSSGKRHGWQARSSYQERNFDGAQKTWSHRTREVDYQGQRGGFGFTWARDRRYGLADESLGFQARRKLGSRTEVRGEISASSDAAVVPTRTLKLEIFQRLGAKTELGLGVEELALPGEDTTSYELTMRRDFGSFEAWIKGVVMPVFSTTGTRGEILLRKYFPRGSVDLEWKLGKELLPLGPGPFYGTRRTNQLGLRLRHKVGENSALELRGAVASSQLFPDSKIFSLAWIQSFE